MVRVHQLVLLHQIVDPRHQVARVDQLVLLEDLVLLLDLLLLGLQQLLIEQNLILLSHRDLALLDQMLRIHLLVGLQAPVQDLAVLKDMLRVDGGVGLQGLVGLVGGHNPSLTENHIGVDHMTPSHHHTGVVVAVFRRRYFWPCCRPHVGEAGLIVGTGNFWPYCHEARLIWND